MAEESKNQTPDVAEPQEVEDENPVKPKRKVNYVLTEARKETLKKGREARMANIKKRNEEKKQQKEEEKQEKREIRAEVAEKVHKKVVKKKEAKKVKITVPESDTESESESDYEIEIKKSSRRSKSAPLPERPPPAVYPSIPNVIFC